MSSFVRFRLLVYCCNFSRDFLSNFLSPNVFSKMGAFSESGSSSTSYYCWRGAGRTLGGTAAPHALLPISAYSINTQTITTPKQRFLAIYGTGVAFFSCNYIFSEIQFNHLYLRFQDYVLMVCCNIADHDRVTYAITAIILHQESQPYS